MQAQVFLPSRKKGGQVIVGRLYRGRYRLEGDVKATEVALGVTDESEARERLQAIIKDALGERVGAVAPRLQRETAQKELGAVIEDFLKSREALGRDHKYVLGVKQQLQRMVLGAKWKVVSDITLDSFERWRSCQTYSPKTLNDYLVTLNAFLNWMVKTGRIEVNPLRSAEKVSIGAYECRERRAVSWEELQKLSSISEERGGLVYCGWPNWPSSW